VNRITIKAFLTSGAPGLGPAIDFLLSAIYRIFKTEFLDDFSGASDRRFVEWRSTEELPISARVDWTILIEVTVPITEENQRKGTQIEFDEIRMKVLTLLNQDRPANRKISTNDILIRVVYENRRDF
jgi:hypothetical protein